MNLQLLKYCLILLFIKEVNYQHPQPNFHPFIEDHPFIHVDQILDDTTLTVKGDCMAFGHSKSYQNYHAFYVIYANNGGYIHSKGLEIPLSTRQFTMTPFPIPKDHGDILSIKYYHTLRKKDSIQRHIHVDTVKIDSILAIYNLTRKREIIVKDTSFSHEKKYFWIYTDSKGKEYPVEKQVSIIDWITELRGRGKIRMYYDSDCTMGMIDTSYLKL